MTIEQGRLRNDVKAAVLDFQRIFPPPYRLAPNLDLAVRAIAALDQSAERLTKARHQRRMAEERSKAWSQQYDYDMRQENERADAAEARIKAVRKLHAPSEYGCQQECREDHGGIQWPCPTIRALDGEA